MRGKLIRIDLAYLDNKILYIGPRRELNLLKNFPMLL